VKKIGPAFAGPPGHRRRAGCCLGPSVDQQRRVEVLSPVKHTDDGYEPRGFVHGVGDQGASPVVGDAKAGADVFARHAAQREECQALAGLDHRARVALGYRQRGPFGDVDEQLFELVARLGRVDDAVVDQALVGAFADAFLCAAASRAFTAPTATARDGSAFSLS
jgi:hypothetical protein